MNKRILRCRSVKSAIFFIICLMAIESKAQFPYGTYWIGYPPSYTVSSGFKTNNTPGFLWLGYLSNVSPIPGGLFNNKNFFISGLGQSAISAAYQVFDGTSPCNGQLKQVLDGLGISAIESSTVANIGYAIAGAYNEGCFFATLNNGGIPVSTMLYPFPSHPTASYPRPSKPLIVEDGSSGDYYICGSFEGDMYVLKVAPTGNIIWSNFYKLANGIYPQDIIYDPYAPNSIVIVGKTETVPGDMDGFFTEIDALQGGVITLKTFGSPGLTDEFYSISAASNAGAGNGAGFIVGGNNMSNLNSGNAWVLKVDPSGSIIWNNIIKPTSGTNTGVVDIIERFNTSSTYEYYGLLSSSVGMQVIKLDASGIPFPLTTPNGLNNEFAYNLPAANPAIPTSLSCVNSPMSSNNVGIQVYGTTNNLTGFSSSYVVMAYFNGETNCHKTLGKINNYSPGPPLMSQPMPILLNGLAACNNFQITSFSGVAALNIPCNGIMSAGSNQKTISTGTEEGIISENKISVFPNPVKDIMVIHYSAEYGSVVTIDLYNMLGEHIKTLQSTSITNAGAFQVEVDLGELNIESGVYFVNTNINGSSSREKVIYNR